MDKTPVNFSMNYEKELNKLIIDYIERKRRLRIGATDKAFIGSAINLLVKKLGQKHRLDYQPMALHSLRVAIKCLSYYKLYDMEMIVAALLHDVVEDSSVSVEEVRNLFGATIAYLVDGLTKFDFTREQKVTKMVKDTASMVKLLLYSQNDLRILLIKFLDRIDNLETIHGTSAQQRNVKINETKEFFIPLADALNMWRVKQRLENLVFRAQNQRVYHDLEEDLRYYKSNVFRGKAPEVYIDSVIVKRIKAELKKRGVRVLKIKFREKSLYSIYQKIEKEKLPLEKVNDIFGIKVIVDKESECYEALNIIKRLYRRIVKEKDYIEKPKPNGYKSLHLVIYEPKLKFSIEIQIKTDEMEAYNEYGPAAHPNYKGWEFDANAMSNIEKIYDVLDAVLRSKQVGGKHFQIGVYTPAGDRIALPAGSTVLDLAYKIHSDLAHHCRGAKIFRYGNTDLSFTASLDEPLEDEDKVEIITDPDAHPAINWLFYARTLTAHKAVKAWLLNYYSSTEIVSKLADDIQKVGQAKHVPPIYSVVRDIYKDIYPADLLHLKKEPISERIGLETVHRIIITNSGKETDKYILALCCSPLFGENIAGIKRGAVLEVHRDNCKTLNQKNIIGLTWAHDVNKKKWKSKIYFSFEKTMPLQKASSKVRRLIAAALKPYKGYYDEYKIDFNKTGGNSENMPIGSGYINISINSTEVVDAIKEAFYKDGSFSNVLPNC